MTPRVGVKTTLTNGNASLGALVPKQGPHFFAHYALEQDSHFWLSASIPIGFRSPEIESTRLSLSLINLPCDRNIQLMQHVRYFGVAKP